MPLDKSSSTVLTPGEVADIFRVTPDAVRQWADDGKLASFKTPGGQRRFLRSDVERFFADAVEPAPALASTDDERRESA